MRVARIALAIAFASFVIHTAVSAQTLRSTYDPRNQAPIVGTGGTEAGGTGLFTVYDADTIRRGEFTFSIAYSNFDRDPGDVDLVEVPLSFNLGLNDHLELFFNVNGYRGIRVNNPQNLSSFYLPNSQLFFGPNLLCSGSAVIITPQRVSGTSINSSPVFRPAGPPCGPGGQPFRPFPFIGATGPNLALTGNAIAPPFVSVIGAPTGGGGNFGSASLFPGMGSPVGSIFPGIVLATRTIPANLTFNVLTVPETFTTAPAYLPEAPFINRLYGESSFTDMTVGAKIRLTGPNNPLGVAIVPFYRWWPDSADDASGFNQLQRGAGGASAIGDFGLMAVVSRRLSKIVNVSANLGYILNSNPKSEAMNDAVLLDRPDEFLAGVGFDFPINEHFQLIAEARSTHYVGGRTQNAFNNNPVEVLGGIRIFPRRWWGFGAAYRRHLNQQDQKHFKEQFPVGFRGSNDPHGFLFQVWAGRRNPPTPPFGCGGFIVVSVSASVESLTLPCPPDNSSPTCPASESFSVELTANATDPGDNVFLYTWSVTAGKVSGEGRKVNWDLSGVGPGVYTASVEVNDGHQHLTMASTTVTVMECHCHFRCPTISVSCPADVVEGQPITFTASISSSDANLTYEWSVSAGTITSGQGTSSITVDIAGLGGQSITGTLEVGGLDPACSKKASCSTPVAMRPREIEDFDNYGDIRFNDEKARLDNYAIQLQSLPGSQGYIVAYGNCEGSAQVRANRAKDYLVNTRGVDAGRIMTIDGGCRADLMVELWIIPPGATAPTATATDNISPCPPCRTPKRINRPHE
ncbi:MAG TPA: hypothetical protein VJU84_02555 [Pyrinomonadaceae bacterium]|nr:hypothetical protein [Pyrinomonadaceae bacterium]